MQPNLLSKRGSLLRRASATWFIGVITVVCVWFLSMAQTYTGNAWKYPTGVASIAVVLCLIELVRKLLRADHVDPGETEFAASRQRALAVGGWLIGTVFLVYVVGLLAGVFISVGVYFYTFVRRSLWIACSVGAAHTGFLWIVFDVAAGLRLYGGI